MHAQSSCVGSGAHYDWRATLAYRDSQMGNQQWVFTKVPGKPNTYTIQVRGGRNCSSKFVGVKANCGDHWVYMQEEDKQNTGLQHWRAIKVEGKADTYYFRAVYGRWCTHNYLGAPSNNWNLSLQPRPQPNGNQELYIPGLEEVEETVLPAESTATVPRGRHDNLIFLSGPKQTNPNACNVNLQVYNEDKNYQNDHQVF